SSSGCSGLTFMRPITSEPCIRVGHDERTMPIYLQIKRYFIEQCVAQKVISIHYPTRLVRMIDNDDPFLSRRVQLSQERASRFVFTLRQCRSLVYGRESYNAQGID